MAEAPALVVVLDAGGRYVAVNAAWTAILGWSEGETLGQRFERFIHPEDHASARSAVEWGFGGHVTLGYENRLRTRDGRYRWIRWTAPENGPPSGIALGLDVTSELEARHQAERMAGRLRSVMEAAPGFIVALDHDGRILWLNRSRGDLPEAQIVGSNGFDWIPVEFRDRLRNALERVFAGDVLPEQVLEAETSRGPNWFKVNFAPLVEGGETTAVIAYCEDVTAQKRGEQMRARASWFEAVGRTAAVIGHDFNNLLMTMHAAAEVIAAERGLQGVRTELELLLGSLERAGELTRNLLRPFKAGGSVAPKVDLTRTVRELEPVLRSAVGQTISVSFLGPFRAAYVRVPEHEVCQALVNLIINAKEASDDDCSLAISTNIQSVRPGEVGTLAGGRYATIDVRDDGPGIPPEHRHRVFEPFFTTKEEGRGFGLAICYGIAKAYGGEVELSCPPTGGTLVRLWFPLAAEEEGVGPSEPAPDAADGPSGRFSSEPSRDPSRKLVILLAEDEHGTRAAVARYLSKLGHLVLEGGDGAEALELAERHPNPIDVLITDLVMPRVNGRALIQELRRRHPEIPVLAMTGYAAPDELDGLAELGVKVLQKPVSVRVLADTAYSLVAASRSERSTCRSLGA